jgi:hypothetical protein
MRIRKKWFELETNTDHTHWCIHYSTPSDDCDSWDWREREHGRKPTYRSWLTIGIWRLFFMVYLWKVTPFKGDWGQDNTRRYGITFFERSVHLHWGETKVYWLPWDWEIVRHDLLYPNGDVYWHNKFPRIRLGEKSNSYSWHQILDGGESPYPKSDAETELVKYVDLVHHTKSGKKQVARIRLAGEEREWRYRWFKWLPWPRKISRVVDCWSDAELGERAGSWKGGMLGWSVEWREDESIEGAFWRWYKHWDGR